MNNKFEVGKIYASNKTLIGKSDLMYEYCGYREDLKTHVFKIVSPVYGREMSMFSNIRDNFNFQYAMFSRDNVVISVAELSYIIEYGSSFFDNDLTELRNKWREFYKNYKNSKLN